MMRTEERLIDALAARASAVEASSLRPLPLAGPGAERDGAPRHRWLAPAAAAASVVVIAAAVTVAANLAPRAGPAPYRPGRPPAISGHGVSGLWQGAPWEVFTVAGGLVLGARYANGQDVVEAVSALTGAPVWTARPPRAQPQVLGIIAGAGVVIVEAGHVFGGAAGPGTWVAGEEMVLDAGTGKLVWAVAVPGHTQAPALAIAGSVVVSGGRGGGLAARAAATGRLIWQRPAPSGCPASAVPGSRVSVAADGPLLAASFPCPGGRVLVQRLAPATGKLAWQWQSPPAGGGGQAAMDVIGAARQGQLILLAGQVALPAAAGALARAVPRSYAWPRRLGPPDAIDLVLALDAATGHPRWIEAGGQQQGFSLADGAVCESVAAGLECRDDITGAPTRPLLLTGQPASAVPPYGADGAAGISGSDAAVTVAPFRPGHVRLVVVPIRHGGQLASASLAIGITAPGVNEHTFVVAAGQLPGGGTLILLRRIDRPGYPLVALKVTR